MTSPAFPSAPDLSSSESLIKRGSSERGTSSTDKDARDLAAGSSSGRDFSFRDFLARDRLRSEARSASAQKSPKDDSSADSKADAASSPSDKKSPATDDDAAAAANDTRDAAAQDAAATPAVAAPSLGVSARQILLAAEAAATNAASDAAATPPSAGPKKLAAATDDDSADAPASADGETVASTAIVVDPSVLAMAIIAPPPVAPDAAKPLPTTGAGSSDASTGAATTTSSGVLDGAQISATDTALGANAKSTLPTPSASVANQATTADADPKSSAATTSQTSDQSSSVAAKIADGRISQEMAGKSPTPTALSQVQEKIAAVANASATTENMGKAQRRNNFLTVDGEQEKKSSTSVGTEAAKSDVTMATHSNAPTANGPQESVFPVRPEMVNAATGARADAASGLVPGADSVKSQAGAAVNVIREVVAATDDMRAQERSSVSLQFNFKDEARLDVRVTYRDGAVHSTFVTDSPELRDTLSREWQVQASAASAQPKPYRLADPVFASNASGGQPSGFSLGGDLSRQSSQQQPQARPDSPSDLFPPSAFNRAPVTASASARPAPAANAETVRHLQVFA